MCAMDEKIDTRRQEKSSVLLHTETSTRNGVLLSMCKSGLDQAVISADRLVSVPLVQNTT